MVLSHRVHSFPGSTPSRFALLLHGFLGQGRNWASIAKKFVAARPEWAVVTPDLRLHGGSQPASPPYTVEACAEDLASLSTELDMPFSAVLGHSFGGKVALQMAKRGAPLEQVWVLDSTPRAMAPGGSALEMLQRLADLRTPSDSRGDVIQTLMTGGLGKMEAQWVATNLKRTNDGFVWALDLDALRLLILDFYQSDLWAVAESPAPGVQLHFVQALQSGVLVAEDIERLSLIAGRHGRVAIHPLDSGHWVNVGDPDGLLALMTQHL